LLGQALILLLSINVGSDQARLSIEVLTLDDFSGEDD
jgi:hypothetical protein